MTKEEAIKAIQEVKEIVPRLIIKEKMQTKVLDWFIIGFRLSEVIEYIRKEGNNATNREKKTNN